MNRNVSEMHNLWPEKVTFGEIVYPPGGNFGPRIQAHLQLVILYSGYMNVWIDGVQHHAPAQSVFILLPGHEESFAFAQESETWHGWVHLTLSPDANAHLEARLNALKRPLLLSGTMHQLSRAILAQDTLILPTAQEIVKALALQMLWLYVGESELQTLRGDRPQHQAVEQAKIFMQAHIHDPLTLELIASEVALSPAHLIRLFRLYGKTTPMAYLWESRVKKGITLLEETGLTVGKIAEQCGFQTRYHFSRRVHQLLGYGPQEVRRRSWKIRQ